MSGLAPLKSSYIGRSSDDHDDDYPTVGASSVLPDDADLASSLLSARSFYFAERTRPIDIETLRNLDLKRIEDDVDIEALQRHLEELTFGDLGKSIAAPLGVEPRNADFLKLFRLAQLTVEYLLNVQDVLAEGLETSSRKCREGQHRVDKYKARCTEMDAKIKLLKSDLKVKKGAIHTYEALINDTRGSKQGRSSSSRRSSARAETTRTSFEGRKSFEDEEERLTELTVYVSSPDGTCAKHAVESQTTAGELAERFGPRPQKILHRGVELGRDVHMGSVGVKTGDTLVLVPLVKQHGYGPVVHHDGLLDARIAELESSIRSEMAVQVQTQLASLRGSHNPIGGLGAWGDAAQGASQGNGCIAGALEDDDGEDQLGFIPPGHTPSSETEERLRRQMEALERRMAEIAQNAERVASRPNTPAYYSPSPQRPTQQDDERSQFGSSEQEQPVSKEEWTLRCTVLSLGPDEPMEKGDDEGGVELVLEQQDTLDDVRAALATELDVEVDRIRLRRRSDGRDFSDVGELKTQDVVCQVVRGRVVSDEQTDALRVMRKSLAKTQFAEQSDAALGRKLEAAVSGRMATWRSLPNSHGSNSSLSQAEVARLELRVGALSSLMETVERTSAFDEEMIGTLSSALETVCDGLPPSVNDAILRVRASVDERAALLASSSRQQH